MSSAAFLRGSHAQYKEDTNSFITWLSQSARACGFTSDTSKVDISTAKTRPQPAEVLTAPSQRLKGKARKVAKQTDTAVKPQAASAIPVKATRYKITSREIIEQAKAVAEFTAKPVPIPAGVRAVLERAIAARHRCAAWYAKSGAETVSDKGHKHFIQVLENALDVLQWSKPETGSGDQRAVASKKNKGGLDLSNRFSQLEVQEADEEFPFTPLDVAETSMRAGKPNREVYELEDDFDDFDDDFMLFCFFEDLHAMQEEIGKVWRNFRDGKTALDVATIVTQAGIDMVKRLEKETMARRKDVLDPRNSYTELSLPVYYAESWKNGLVGLLFQRLLF